MSNVQRVADEIGEHGSSLTAGFLTPDELRSARKEAAEYFPSSAELVADPARLEGLRRAAGFPFDGDTLNHVATHPGLIALAETLMGTDDVRLGDAILQAKYGPELTEDRDQRLHNDAWGRNSLVFPRTDGRYQRLFVIVYLSDVDATSGPTHVVPSAHASSAPLLASTGHAAYDRSEFPELYAHERAVLAPAGSVLTFTGATVHRGSAVTAPTGERYALFLNFHAAAATWLDKQTWNGSAVSPLGPRVARFVESATPRQLAVLGFPRPGDDYWTAETLAGVASLYPGLDLTPYRAGR